MLAHCNALNNVVGMQRSNPIKKQIRGRYAKLRPHLGRILEWCLEGRQWLDIAQTLTAEGVAVTAAAIQSSATASGADLLHPYSPYFDPQVRTRYEAGHLTANDLKPLSPNKTRHQELE